MDGNTILITGGGSGIGLALGEAFLRLGNKVVVAGRSENKLAAAAARGLGTLIVDLTDAASIKQMAARAIEEYPGLNVVIHNAGIMKNENLLRDDNAATQTETVLTNFLGPMRLTDVLLPHLLQKPGATIMTVSSGLAFAPLSMTPTYSATKAAIHSYTQSLRYQLRRTTVHVVELVPPYVQTELMGERQAKDPHAMPLGEFITEVMDILKAEPNVREILVKCVLPQRTSGDKGVEAQEQFVVTMNNQLTAARQSEL